MQAGVSDATDGGHHREGGRPDEGDQARVEHADPEPFGREALADDAGSRPDDQRLRMRQEQPEADENRGVEPDLHVSARAQQHQREGGDQTHQRDS